MLRRTPRSTRTDTLFPYTTLCRSIASDGMLRPVVSERFPTGRMIASVRGDAPVPNICIKPFLAQSAGELQGHVEALLQSRFMLIGVPRSEEHTSELQSLMRISYAVFCLNNKTSTYRQSHY